jgi:hypothetical protein
MLCEGHLTGLFDSFVQLPGYFFLEEWGLVRSFVYCVVGLGVREGCTAPQSALAMPHPWNLDIGAGVVGG